MACLSLCAAMIPDLFGFSSVVTALTGICETPEEFPGFGRFGCIKVRLSSFDVPVGLNLPRLN